MRGAGVMIEKFTDGCGMVRSEFLDLNHTSKDHVSSVPYDCEVRAGCWRQGMANFAIGTLA
jgi:hypothetical protein